LCCLSFAAFAPFTPGFASPGNAWNILISCLPLLVLATGQTIVLITGGIDLSVTAIIGLSSVVGGLVMTGDHGWLANNPAAAPVALAAMLGTGALVGFFNGACIAWLRMPAFMVTLTMTMFFTGFAVWLAKKAVNAESIYNLPPAFLALGSKAWLAALLAVAVTFAAYVVLSRTLLGRWLYAVGHNPRASLISGVPVGGVTVSAYVLSGLFAAVAAVLLTARLETASPNHGKQLLLDVIGAAVIGGTSLFGGRGTIVGTVLGALTVAVIGNGLILAHLSPFLTPIVTGTIILIAIWLNFRIFRGAVRSR
jgi:ribose/xylose/arabinose/galactoside ABC-type transport system permease subunit